jgi:short chain dehydrogenase
VVGLGVGEPQRVRDRGQDVARRAWRPALLEADVVLGGDVREDRHFLAAQTWCAASRSGGEADVLRAQPLATAAEERAEFLFVHTPSVRAARPRILVQPVPVSGRRPAGLGVMTNTTNTTNTTDSTPIGLLTGKVIFITGASRGIGAAAARLFASEGAAVVLAARSTDALERIVKEIRADGHVADDVTLDLADPASIRRPYSQRRAVTPVQAVQQPHWGLRDAQTWHPASGPGTAGRPLGPTPHFKKGGTTDHEQTLHVF